MTANNIRFDLSPYLIHFFRRLDFSKADVAYTPEEWGPGDMVENDRVSPLFLLRNAVRLGRLWATWSMRNGRRTIYGPNSAICFTDMPIAAFIQSGRDREAKGEAMSPIALVLPRSQMLAAGALPAIYGLAGKYNLPKGDDGSERLMPSEALPALEQFRYVTLSGNGAIDWTHEREWRWPYRGKPLDVDGTPTANGADIPGLDLHFEGMGAIVRTKDQAQRVLHDILVQTDRGAQGGYDFILVGDDVKKLSTLVDPKEVQAVLASAAIDLAAYRTMDATKRKTLVAAFDKSVADVDQTGVKSNGRELGACWLWVTDIMHEMARALLLEGRVTINAEGRYLVKVQAFDPDLDLSVREELTRRLAAILGKRHALAASYHSILNGSDPDALPMYADPPFENRMLFNFGDDASDF